MRTLQGPASWICTGIAQRGLVEFFCQDLAERCSCVNSTGASQAELYEKCAAGLVEKFLGGANACLLAYGQTASGKTYTAGTDGGI